MTASSDTAARGEQDHAPVASGRRWPGRGERSPRESGSSLVLTRLGHVVLWLLVLGGAGASAVALGLHTASSAAAPTPEPPAPTTPAEGFAELYVATYLGKAGSGAEDAIAAFYPDAVALGDVTPGAVWVTRTAAVAVDEQAPGYWAVTVAAEVLTAAADAWQPAQLRYYTVGVADSGGALVATGLPSQVAAPPVAADAPEPVVAALGSVGDEPAIEAVEQFLAAYLTGDGDLDRYLAPHVDLTAVDPPPFADVELARVGTAALEAGGALVRVEATATDERGLVQVLEYSLEVVERDGRVEIAALHPAPPLPQPADR